MADFSALKQSIETYIKNNGNKEITGAILQNILLSMVTTMGDGAINDNASDISDIKGDIQNINGDITDINGDITDINVDITDVNGAITNINGDITGLNGDLSDEINRAKGAETTTILFSDGKLVFKNAVGTVLYQLNVDSFLNAITTRLNTGALYAGYATPSTTPAALTSQEVFYLATQAGTYTNFHFNGGDDPIVLTKDGIYFIVSGNDDDDWNAEPMLQLDDVPTASSNNAVKSGGVAEELALGAVYDVSAKNPTAGTNNDGKWESLSALLSDANLNTIIPTSVRKGGMSVKYVSSVDNKYVQYRLMSPTWSNDEANWQGVDDEPTAGSDNLVKSGGVFEDTMNIRGFQVFNAAASSFYNCLKNKFIDSIYEGGSIKSATNCATTGLINIQGVKKLKIKTSTPMKKVYGWRALAQDGETILAYGHPADNTVTELNIDVETNWYYFQYSEEKGIYETTTFLRDCEENISDSIDYIDETKGDDVESFAKINSTTNYYIDPADGTVKSTEYDSRLSDLIDIHGLNTVVIKCPENLQTVWGWRILAQDGETVLYYGGTLFFDIAVTPRTKEIVINISDDAYYLQWSHISSLYLQSTLTKLCTSSIGDVLSLVKKGNFYYASKEITNQNITIEGGSSHTPVTVISPSDDNMVSDHFAIVANFKLTGSFSSGVTLLVGNNYYGKSYIIVTSTFIKEIYINNSNQRQYNHGLTIEDYLTVIVTRDFASNMYVRIMTKTGSFMQKLEVFDGTDGITVTNWDTDSIILQQITRNYSVALNKKILVFGDSYAHDLWGIVHQAGFNYSWTTALKIMGADFANIGYPGGSNISMLERFINWGARPRYIIFATGMNYQSDTDDTTPNSDFVSDLNVAKSLAESINAELIPCTIPTVPNKNNNGKTYYVTSNFERYIDFAGCLTSNGEWKTGYLASDNVHPSALGFEAMIAKVVADFPEIL